jgi:hypothetical protein
MIRLARLPTLLIPLALGLPTDSWAGEITLTLEQANSQLEKGDAKAAVATLESVLTTASPSASTEERGRVLLNLRRAYESALQVAESEGNAKDIETYRENLKILQRKNNLPRPLAPPAPITHSAVEVKPEEGPGTRGLMAPIARVADVSPPDVKPRRNTTPPSGADPPTDTSSTRAPVTRTISADALLGADETFRAKRYGEASRLYASLAVEKRLPETRRGPWVYARCKEVEGRINARPTDDAEWTSILREIDQIRQLSPAGNWAWKYLHDVATERSAAARKSNTRKVVYRGASPEEPVPVAEPSRTSRPAASAIATPVPSTARVGRPGTPINNWQVWDTTNFRILHSDDGLAEKVARIAEATRDDQMRRWIGVTAPATAWAPRCDLYLYPSGASFHQMTDQPAESPGFSTIGMNSGRIVARRVNLRADHAKLLVAIVPHEITHIILADLFPNDQIPRWADEGMAVLSEPDPEQHLRASDLAEPLSSGRLFRLQDLMTMDYPDGRHWSLYYAQSVSLTRFLVSQGTPSQFVKFVRDAQHNGVETELKRCYRIDGFADLDKRWRAHARTASTSLATANVGR